MTVTAETYNPNVKAILYNRVLIFLGFFGLFVAGVLSLAKVMDVVPPCGSSHGCDIVTNGPWAYWFTGFLPKVIGTRGVPVAYVGLVGYVILAALAVARAVGPASWFKRLSSFGYLFAVGGTLISLGLQFQSIMNIHQICLWCMTSAITMTITLIVYALLYQEATELTDEQISAAKTGSKLDSLLPGALVVVLILSLTAEGFALRNGEHSAGVTVVMPAHFALIPENPNIFGEPNAPVKIVEFADLNCPSCQTHSPLVKEFVREHPGGVCVIYRHFPLVQHKTSKLASAIDEYAAEKGKFWDFTLAVMGRHEESQEQEELFQIASSLNLDVNDIKKRLANDDDAIYKRLSADISAGNTVGISQTPTFVVVAPELGAKAFTGGSLLEALKADPYRKLINGK